MGLSVTCNKCGQVMLSVENTPAMTGVVQIKCQHCFYMDEYFIFSEFSPKPDPLVEWAMTQAHQKRAEE